MNRANLFICKESINGYILNGSNLPNMPLKVENENRQTIDVAYFTCFIM